MGLEKELIEISVRLKKHKLFMLGFAILNALCIVINIVFGAWWIVTFMNILAIIVCLKLYLMLNKILKEIELDDT